MSVRHRRVRMEPVVRRLRMVTAVSHVLQDGREKIVMKVCLHIYRKIPVISPPAYKPSRL